MDNMKILEEVGLKRVCEETHIEEKYLQHMVNRDFDKLDYINTQGFIKILSREYKLDLSEWSEEFKKYWEENRKNNNNNKHYVPIDDEKNSKKLLIFTIIIIISTIAILFFIFKDKINFSNYNSSDKVTYEQASVIEEAQKSLDELNDSLEEIGVNKELNISAESIKQEIQIDELTETVSSTFPQEAIITPSSQLWLGIIYLDTKERRSFLGDGNISIDISREQIITTGHGNFYLTIDNKKSVFKNKEPLRFLVKDLNITQISWSKFKALNEGKYW
ncbi:MAG: hypothetical protein JJV95_00475 [Sulfurospirillum sp.]|nr:hypothetical protein [Sulfurospirillum sp.]MBL0702442.1 hypothetical protein [Sulfurospirillum sp.]